MQLYSSFQQHSKKYKYSRNYNFSKLHVRNSLISVSYENAVYKV